MARNRRSELSIVNVRPADYNTRKYCKGDCTTRAITYTLNMTGDNRDYTTVEAEQYRLAKALNKVRNCTGVYDLILKKHGYQWIQLNRVVSRDRLANMLKQIDSPILTLSRSHICPIHRGNIIDTWDSRGGRTFGLMCKNTDINIVHNLLAQNNVDFVDTEKPTHKVNHHHHNLRWW